MAEPRSWRRAMAERDQAIVAAVEAGRSKVEVAREHGMTPGGVNFVVARYRRRQAMMDRHERPIVRWLGAKLAAHPDDDPALYCRLHWFFDIEKIDDLEGLCAWTEDEVWRTPNIGKGSLGLLKRLLEEDGLKLAEGPSRPMPTLWRRVWR